MQFVCIVRFDYTKPKNIWSLRFKLEVFIWHVVYVPKSSTTISGDFNLCDF